MLADNEKWVLISSYSPIAGTPDGPFHDEIYQVATDGSLAVRRVAHHFSSTGTTIMRVPAPISAGTVVSLLLPATGELWAVIRTYLS
jgi:hypothetical protein